MSEDNNRLLQEHDSPPSDDPTVDDIRDQILSIPMITDIIFDHLNLADIFSCSVSSKTLFSTTRDYIRRRRTLLLKCTCEIAELQECVRVWSKNPNESILPKIQFHGAHFVIITDDYRRWNMSSEEVMAYEEKMTAKYKKYRKKQCKALIKKLLEQIEMKHLVVTFPVYTKERSNHDSMCWGIFFPLLHLLNGDETETVTVNGNDENIRWLKRLHGGFKNLKSVETDSLFGNFDDYDIDRTNFDNFENLLVNCPALQEINIPVHLQYLSKFDTHGKLSFIKSLLIVCVNFFDPSETQFAERLVKSGASLEMLTIYMYYKSDDGRYKYLEELFQLLQPCLNSVRKVAIRFYSCNGILEMSLPCLPRAEEVYYRKFYHMGDLDRAAIEDRLQQSYPQARIIDGNQEWVLYDYSSLSSSGSTASIEYESE